MKQVYLDTVLSIHDVIELDTKQAHHIFDVLRTTPKEKIRIITKNSGVFLGHVENKPTLIIDSIVDVFEENQSITLCCALIKQDKFEWMLQKACELGVTKIVPFVSKNTVVKLDEKKAEKKQSRWNEILLAATHYLKDNPKSITICIGPEGGFEESEIQVLNEFGYENCSLGKNILRAETAACYVLSAIEYQNHVEG